MNRYTFSLLAALLALSFSHPTSFHYYASFKGTKQGQFKGESTRKGGREKDGWFLLSSFDMTSEVAVDSKSGSAKRPQTHPHIVITKEIDAATPRLLTAHNTNEPLESVIIQTVDYQNKTTRRITLTNVLISDIKKNGTLESISLNYEKIETQ